MNPYKTPEKDDASAEEQQTTPSMAGILRAAIACKVIGLFVFLLDGGWTWFVSAFVLSAVAIAYQRSQLTKQ